MAHGAIEGGFVRHVNVAVPTTALKMHWATEFAEHGLHLDTQYRTGHPLAHGLHGVAVTYQQIAERPHAYEKLFRSSLVIPDEIHHAGVDTAWGDALETADRLAAHRLHLSGTAFRSDRRRIAHLRYDGRGYVIADYYYPYARAVRDKIVRPVVAYPASATVKWKSGDGTIRESSFEERGAKQHEAERLRAVLSHAGWVGDLLTRANALLMALRKTERDAAGLVACMTAAHARFVADVMRNTLGIDPVIVLHEDEASDQNIARFRNSQTPWMIAVRKVSEGIDIPRLRVLSYLTNARTELIFRQLVGRIVRTRNADARPGYVFYPADPTLDELMKALRDEIMGDAADAPAGLERHAEAVLPADVEDAVDREIEVLSATFHELSPYDAIGATVDPNDLFAPKRGAEEEALERNAAVDSVLMRGNLRKIVTAITRDVAHTFGLDMHDVYAHFAKLRGPIDRADPPELQRRINSMRRWLDKGSHPVRRTTRSGR